jgi:hypothetical protein
VETDARTPAARVEVHDLDDVRVLIAALDAFANDADAQARDEAGWPEDDVPDAHVGMLRAWAARARTLCARAERALDEVTEDTSHVFSATDTY